MRLLELPADIINILPNYFSSIYDLYNVLLTCRALCSAYHESEVRLSPILPKPNGQLLFRPQPHLLLTLLARQIGDWAVSSPSNRYELYKTLSHGYDGLFSLAERVTYVSLSDLRHLHNIKYFVLNPLTRIVDFEVGPAMVLNQDIDPQECGIRICKCPDLAVMNHVVYCELFHHYVDEILASAEPPANGSSTRNSDQSIRIPSSQKSPNVVPQPSVGPRSLQTSIRNRFIAHCLPDRNDHRNPSYVSLGRGPDRASQWQLLDYLEFSRCHSIRSRDVSLRRFWNTGVLQPLPDGEDLPPDGVEWDWTPSFAEKREELFVLVAGHLGYTSLKMLLLDGMKDAALVAQLASIRGKVQAIPELSIARWQFWSEDVDNEGVNETDDEDERFTWEGMASDCHGGMSSNQERDEDLREQAEREEKRLRIALEQERRSDGVHDMRGQLQLGG